MVKDSLWNHQINSLNVTSYGRHTTTTIQWIPTIFNSTIFTCNLTSVSKLCPILSQWAQNYSQDRSAYRKSAYFWAIPGCTWEGNDDGPPFFSKAIEVPKILTRIWRWNYDTYPNQNSVSSLKGKMGKAFAHPWGRCSHSICVSTTVTVSANSAQTLIVTKQKAEQMMNVLLWIWIYQNLYLLTKSRAFHVHCYHELLKAKTNLKYRTLKF